MEKAGADASRHRVALVQEHVQKSVKPTGQFIKLLTHEVVILRSKKKKNCLR